MSIVLLLAAACQICYWAKVNFPTEAIPKRICSTGNASTATTGRDSDWANGSRHSAGLHQGFFRFAASGARSSVVKTWMQTRTMVVQVAAQGSACSKPKNSKRHCRSSWLLPLAAWRPQYEWQGYGEGPKCLRLAAVRGSRSRDACGEPRAPRRPLRVVCAVLTSCARCISPSVGVASLSPVAAGRVSTAARVRRL